jgi:hypothetical protein
MPGAGSGIPADREVTFNEQLGPWIACLTFLLTVDEVQLNILFARFPDRKAGGSF